jgi:hypothetical protein
MAFNGFVISHFIGFKDEDSISLSRYKEDSPSPLLLTGKSISNKKLSYP